MKVMIEIPAGECHFHKEEIEELLPDMPSLNDADVLKLSYDLNWTIDKRLLKKLKAVSNLVELFPGKLEGFDSLDGATEICRLLQDIQNLVESKELEEEWTD